MADPAAPASGVSVQDLIRQVSRGAGVPPELALAVAEQESGFNPTAMGPEITIGGKKVRAVGTFQLIPSTAQGLGVDPSDPQQNIIGGVRYLRQLLDEHDGDLNTVLRRYGGVSDSNTTSKYADEVLARLSKFQGGVETPIPAGQPGVAGQPTPAGPVGAPAGPGSPGGRTGGPGLGPAPGTISADVSGFDPASLLTPLDPRNPEGRQNLAAAAGAAGASLLTRGLPVQGVAPWIYRAVVGPMGAALGGAAAEATEETLGTVPTTPGGVTNAGLKQGAYEVAGQTLLWPIKRVLRGFIGGKVARDAKGALDARIAGAIEQRELAKVQARADVQEGVAAARALRTASVDATKRAGELATRETKKQAANRLADVELANADLLAQARRQYDDLLAKPPSVQGAAGAVRTVLDGPAKAALDKAGERVAQAAAAGPDISMRPIKDALNTITSKFRPDSIFGQTDAATADAIGFVSQLNAGQRAAVAAQVGTESADTLAIAKALGLSSEHPLPGILGKVQSAPDSITFADAHKLKMLLDEAVNWDRVAKKHLEKITKGLRNVVREELGSFEPYNTATAAYEAVIPLYRRGVGRQVTRAALDAPDRIVKTLRMDRPAEALALKSLLVDQAAAGGDKAVGQEAWDSVRAAWTHENLLRGGVEGLQDRVKKMVTDRPEFTRIVYGDTPGLMVLSNLDAIGEAYTSAVGTAAARTEATKVAGKSAEEIVRDTTKEAVRLARQQGAANVAGVKSAGEAAKATVDQATRAALTTARTERKALQESTLRQGTFVGQGADVLRAIFQGPQSVWGALSIMRLLKGPQAGELLQYAAYSPRLTQNVVAVLTSQAPDRVVSDTLRELVGVLNPSIPQPVPSHQQEPPRAPVPAVSH